MRVDSQEGAAIRTLVHLSDLHFGRTEPGLLGPLRDTVYQVQPDVVVISGDLTQDAREREFRSARRFLDSLPQPRIVVPGNHDLPFYNPLRRVVKRLGGYKRWITTDFEPRYQDGEMVVAGVNTARLFPIRGGRINERQIEQVRRLMSGAPPHLTRVLVTHHPFDLAQTFAARELVGRARLAMGRLASCVDVLLAGHMHVAHTGHTALRYKRRGQSAVFVQAGTAISTRIRGEQNSFNVVRIDPPRVKVERFAWVPERGLFVAALTDVFEKREAQWHRIPPERALTAG